MHLNALSAGQRHPCGPSGRCRPGQAAAQLRHWHSPHSAAASQLLQRSKINCHLQKRKFQQCPLDQWPSQRCELRQVQLQGCQCPQSQIWQCNLQQRQCTQSLAGLKTSGTVLGHHVCRCKTASGAYSAVIKSALSSHGPSSGTCSSIGRHRICANVYTRTASFKLSRRHSARSEPAGFGMLQVPTCKLECGSMCNATRKSRFMCSRSWFVNQQDVAKLHSLSHVQVQSRILQRVRHKHRISPQACCLQRVSNSHDAGSSGCSNSISRTRSFSQVGSICRSGHVRTIASGSRRVSICRSGVISRSASISEVGGTRRSRSTSGNGSASSSSGRSSRGRGSSTGSSTKQQTDPWHPDGPAAHPPKQEEGSNTAYLRPSSPSLVRPKLRPTAATSVTTDAAISAAIAATRSAGTTASTTTAVTDLGTTGGGRSSPASRASVLADLAASAIDGRPVAFEDTASTGSMDFGTATSWSHSTAAQVQFGSERSQDRLAKACFGSAQEQQGSTSAQPESTPAQFGSARPQHGSYRDEVGSAQSQHASAQPQHALAQSQHQSAQSQHQSAQSQHGSTPAQYEVPQAQYGHANHTAAQTGADLGPEALEQEIVEEAWLRDGPSGADAEFDNLLPDMYLLGSRAVIDAVQGDMLDVKKLEQVEVIRINMAMVQLGQSRQLQSVAKLLQFMLDRGMANSHTFASGVCAYAAAGRLDLALAAWETWHQQGIDVGPVGASALIKVCGEKGGIALAMQVFHKLLERKVGMNRFSWNCIIMLCVEAGMLEPAMDIFNLMRTETREDCWPDTYTYGLMLNGVVRTRKWALGATLYQCLQEDGIVPDPQVWCHLITIAARTMDTNKAQLYFERMLELGLRPSLHCYNALLHAFGKIGDYHSAWGHYQGLLSYGIWPDEVTYTSLLTAASRSMQPLRVLDTLLHEMQRHRVQLNKFVGSALMNAYRCCHLMHEDSAEECLHRARALLADLQRRNAASPHSYCCLIQMAAQQGSTALVLSLLQDMETGVESPTYKSYSILLQTFSELGLHQLADEMKLRRAHLRPSSGGRGFRPDAEQPVSRYQQAISRTMNQQLSQREREAYL